MVAQRSIILHNDNIRLPSTIDSVHVIHVDVASSGHDILQQAIEKYQLQRFAEYELSRIHLYASPLGAYRTRIDTLSVIPDTVVDVYVRITSPTLASAPL